MRFIFFSLFLLSFSNENSAKKCTSIHCCFNNTIKGDVNYIMSNRIKEVYRVMGVSNDCHVFFGWLHQILNISRENDNVKFNNSNHDCLFKRIAYLKTQGITREMIVLVDAFGRRIRLQNVMSFKRRRHQEELVWIKVNTKDRNEMMFTGTLDDGYDYMTSFNDNYRLFIAARSDSNIRIYELRVFIDDDNTQHAYLTKRHYDLNPVLFPPLDHFLVRVVQLAEQRSNYPIPGITIVPCDHMYTSYLNSTTAIPMVSLFMKSLRNVHLAYSHSHFVYIQVEQQFGSLVNEKCDNRFTYMFYQFEMDKSTMMNGFWSGYSMTTRRSLNDRNAHRRMSYPHVIKRKKPLHLRCGWLEQIGVYLGFAVGIGVTSFFLRCTTAIVQRELKKRSTSSSTLTH